MKICTQQRIKGNEFSFFESHPLHMNIVIFKMLCDGNPNILLRNGDDMSSTVSEKFEIPDSLASIYRDMAVSPVILLKNYALNHVHSMIQKYEAENICFEKKYGCLFDEFRSKVDDMENEENFEWEDDLADWEFAAENLGLWRKKLEEIDKE